ncbi:hypothetical protein GobsT_52870 [Gemmata obscuriglobus]|uniref:Uncharacterized protein n=1 Tax=Gemmata obscuriglobus TaxID=114 RepID=A0A2Z3GZE0_9BACT|nr:hypothetical protein [Gemmata obscuriglobus]AWM36847.1 hypothetical protein C1280_07330 [Gemmata obscuriglobus]QEG30482.1 hypothetical protein GobsT_52870 [Gemmata obscuriglobus]VTS09806.1 unnamed protein product [Gemmata obscuriglobus UQM 2246]
MDYKGGQFISICDTALGATFVSEILNRVGNGTVPVGAALPALELNSKEERFLSIPTASSLQAEKIAGGGKSGKKDGFKIMVPWSLNTVVQNKVGVQGYTGVKLTQDLLDAMNDPAKQDEVMRRLGGLKATTNKLVGGSLTIYMVQGEYKLVVDAGEGLANSGWMTSQSNEVVDLFPVRKDDPSSELKGAQLRVMWKANTSK